MNHKPLIERLSESGNGSAAADADLIARSFGAVIPSEAPRSFNNSVTSMPSVIEAPSGVVPSKETRTALTVLADLIATKPDTEELTDRKQWLITNLSPLLHEVDEFVDCCTERRRAFLKDSLVKIRTQCREAEKHYHLQVRNLNAAELRLQNVAANGANAYQYLQQLAALEKSGQHLPKWANEKETAEWNERYAGAKESVTEANKDAGLAVAERNRLHFLVEPALRSLEKLADEEIRLRNELAGKQFYDPELGLSSKPAGAVRA